MSEWESIRSLVHARAPGEPPSGVVGLAPLQVRRRMLDNGWAPIPITRHDSPSRKAGKAPGISRWDRFAQFDAGLPTIAELAQWELTSAQPGTGLACGDILAVDIDFGSDAKKVVRLQNLATQLFGDTPLIRQGKAPKVALLYRVAGSIATIKLKAMDGSGNGLDIAGKTDGDHRDEADEDTRRSRKVG